MATHEPNIYVVGGGAIGSAMAYQLSKAGHHVTVVGRPNSARLAQLKAEGSAIVLASGERASVIVADTIPSTANVDLILVTVHAHQLSPVLPYLLASPARSILFLTNNWNPAAVRATLGPRAAFGMPFLQSFLDPQGHVNFNLGFQKSFVGSQVWVDVLSGAGVPAQMEGEMEHWLRCHAPVCVAFEGASIAAVKRNGGASWGEAMVYARGVHAAFALLEKQGVELYPWGKVWINRTAPQVFASMLWGMTKVKSVRDLLGAVPGECIAIVGEILKSAKEVGLDADKVEAIRKMMPVEE